MRSSTFAGGGSAGSGWLVSSAFHCAATRGMPASIRPGMPPSLQRPWNVRLRNNDPLIPCTGVFSSRLARSKNFARTCFGVVPSPYCGLAAANFAKSANRSSRPRPNLR